MTNQKERAEKFRALHEREGAFVIPSPRDECSALPLAGSGFEALATVLVSRDGTWQVLSRRASLLPPEKR